MSENKCYCDHCGSVRVIVNYSELPWDIASANKGESGSLCGLCIVQLSYPSREGRVAHRLDSDHDYVVFYEACRNADQQLGRRLLPGFSLSPEMMGMMTVAFVRTKKETTRTAGERILNSAFKAVGVDIVMRRRVGRSVGMDEALTALEQYAEDICNASNDDRAGVAEGAWHTALGYALDIAAHEGWESQTSDPRKPPL
jgi:hypothetical protein